MALGLASLVTCHVSALSPMRRACVRRLLLLLSAAALPYAAALKNCTANLLGCKPSCSPDAKDALGNRNALLHRLCNLCKCRQCEQ